MWTVSITTAASHLAIEANLDPYDCAAAESHAQRNGRDEVTLTDVRAILGLRDQADRIATDAG